MNREEFQRLLDAYGADLARWPDGVHGRAEAASSQPWARALLEEATALDESIILTTEVSPDRIGRAIAGVNAKLVGRPGWKAHVKRWLAPACGLVASGVLGILVGIGVTPALDPKAALVGDLFAAVLFTSDSVLLWSKGG